MVTGVPSSENPAHAKNDFGDNDTGTDEDKGCFRPSVESIITAKFCSPFTPIKEIDQKTNSFWKSFSKQCK